MNYRKVKVLEIECRECLSVIRFGAERLGDLGNRDFKSFGCPVCGRIIPVKDCGMWSPGLKRIRYGRIRREAQA